MVKMANSQILWRINECQSKKGCKKGTSWSKDECCCVDKKGICVGFSRIRPCLSENGIGHRIGPLVADSPELASIILRELVFKYPGFILLDSPGINTQANSLLRSLGFKLISLPILFKTIVDSIDSQSTKALLAIEKRSITFGPLKLPSAVSKTLHFASLILAARAVEENPAKTTE